MPLKITASGAISSISSCVVAAALTSPMPPTVAATLMTSEPKESTVPDTMCKAALGGVRHMRARFGDQRHFLIQCANNSYSFHTHT